MQIPFLGIQAESQTVSFRGRLTNLSAFQGGTWGEPEGSRGAGVFRTPAIIRIPYSPSTRDRRKNLWRQQSVRLGLQGDGNIGQHFQPR